VLLRLRSLLINRRINVPVVWLGRGVLREDLEGESLVFRVEPRKDELVVVIGCGGTAAAAAGGRGGSDGGSTEVTILDAWQG
jgi:hypothetical protein